MRADWADVLIVVVPVVSSAIAVIAVSWINLRLVRQQVSQAMQASLIVHLAEREIHIYDELLNALGQWVALAERLLGTCYSFGRAPSAEQQLRRAEYGRAYVMWLTLQESGRLQIALAAIADGYIRTKVDVLMETYSQIARRLTTMYDAINLQDVSRALNEYNQIGGDFTIARGQLVEISQLVHDKLQDAYGRVT